MHSHGDGAARSSYRPPILQSKEGRESPPPAFAPPIASIIMTDTAANAFAGPPRVLSGVQPSGALHLGNYLGALKKFVDLQHRMECLFCVVDLHAITAWQPPELLAAQTREIAAAYLAAGVDPKLAVIFPQSAVAAHGE